ncbi:MAG: ROK family protein [Alphaproteobacteria bacterium]|nr:ROK family protein [Alphaproteobacteria bacterium]
MRVGIDLGGTKIEIAALDAGGKFALRERRASPVGDYGATLRTIRDSVIAAESKLGQTCSIGIGIPGTLSPTTGLIKNANSTWLNGKPFDRDLANVLARDVRLANDANCFALSEATDGAGKGQRTVFGVILGTGVGGGIVVDGRVLSGANAIAGEWGHNPLPWTDESERPGKICYCGKTGCIEIWLSGPALSARFAEASGRKADVVDIEKLATGGDAVAQRTLTLYEHRLAKSLAHLINILDPDAIVLGGGVSNLARLYENIPPLLGAHAFSDSITTPLLKNHWGDSSGVRGAAWLWPPA